MNQFNRVDHYFKPGVTSITGIFTPLSGGPREIDVIFDNEYAPLTIQNFETAGSNPRALCKAYQIPDVEEGCLLQIDNVVYKVVIPKPDGYGLIELELTKNV